MTILHPILGFIFVFSVLALVRFTFNFLRALLSTPPKPIEVTFNETVFYGLFISYIITYLICI
jgi:hypothetical protein